MTTVSTTSSTETFFKQKVFGHPAGLFVLFFTEMWERFSYYGMRALLVLFLTTKWSWSNADALTLYGNYTMGVYLTPVLGGWIADKFVGYRKAVVIGAIIMTIGHAAMAVETTGFLYVGLVCLMLGNGLFKPNMTSIISKMYKDYPDKKDGAYSIYYMGVNAGAFLGMLLCGYIGEKISWSWGFGLAGIFMFLGMLQFTFTQKIFGNIGLAPKDELAIKEELEDVKEELTEGTKSSKIVVDRLIVVLIFSLFTVFFWAAFEQAGGSMTLFADKYTQRVLVGNAGVLFKIVDALITIVPLGVITYVLYKLFKQTFSQYKLGNIILSLSFVVIWCLVIWRLNREFSNPATEIAATWFGILNSLFIVILSPLFSKWWESKFNPPAAIKFGQGLILLGIGFAFLAYGANGVTGGVKASLIWLVLAYLFHTMGELSLSPVGLSYVSKLVPAKWIGLMFGVYYLFIAMGNKLAGSMGSMIDEITSKYSLSTFFLIFAVIPVGAGLILWLLHPIIKKLMHGVK